MRKTLLWPNPCLRTAAQPVDQITDDIRAIWDDMVAVMEAMPGIGLAAPQIGVGLRLAVVDASDTRDQVIRMANPDVLDRSPETEIRPEASPCLPGVSADIVRPKTITVRYTDDTGLVVRKELDGLWARSCLHQIDHLNGKMYFDNLSKLKRSMLLKKAAKA